MRLQFWHPLRVQRFFTSLMDAGEGVESSLEAVRRHPGKPINSGRILVRILLGLLVVLALASAIAMVFRQENQMARIRARQAELDVLTAEAEADLAELRELQGLVDTDAYIERVARDQLGMVRPNELIFQD